MNILPSSGTQLPPGTLTFITISRKVGSTTANTGRRPTNNHQSTHWKFRKANNSVLNWDNIFKGFSPTHQDEWNNLSDFLVGWRLCGCTDMVMNGQKLFRATNFNRQMLGMTELDHPPSPLNWTSQTLAAVGAFTDPVTMQRAIAINISTWTFPFWTTFNLGDGLSNPTFSMLVLDNPYIYLPPDPSVGQMIGIPDGTVLTACTFTADGLPMSTQRIGFYQGP